MMEPVATAGGTNQAFGAIAIARHRRDSCIDVICIRHVTAIEIAGDVPTARRLLVERRGEAARPA